jgi:hypothetical protein
VHNFFFCLRHAKHVREAGALSQIMTSTVSSAEDIRKSAAVELIRNSVRETSILSLNFFINKIPDIHKDF